MKRSAMVRKILKELKTWENCKIEYRTASSVLRIIEEAGMLPPGQEKDKITARLYSTGKLLGESYEKYEWENEGRKSRTDSKKSRNRR